MTLALAINFVANLCFLSAYIVRNILWLRILCVCGGVLLIPYYLLMAPKLWEPMAWTCLFMSIHAYWIIRLCRERRPVEFNDEELELYRNAFPTLTPFQMKTLLKSAT